MQSFYLQHKYRELKLLHKEPLLSHRRLLTSTLKAMESSYMFQKASCQQKYQKHSWMSELACLDSFSCLLVPNLSVQSIGSPAPTSSQNRSQLKYNTVLYLLIINSVHS